VAGKVGSMMICHVPKKGFGCSKDAMGKLGPPKFDEAVLDVPAGPVTIVMRTKYR
jgi:uncharacterized protein (DUF2141 family)